MNIMHKSIHKSRSSFELNRMHECCRGKIQRRSVRSWLINRTYRTKQIVELDELQADIQGDKGEIDRRQFRAETALEYDQEKIEQARGLSRHRAKGWMKICSRFVERRVLRPFPSSPFSLRLPQRRTLFRDAEWSWRGWRTVIYVKRKKWYKSIVEDKEILIADSPLKFIIFEEKWRKRSSMTGDNWWVIVLIWIFSSLYCG